MENNIDSKGKLAKSRYEQHTIEHERLENDEDNDDFEASIADLENAQVNNQQEFYIEIYEISNIYTKAIVTQLSDRPTTHAPLRDLEDMNNTNTEETYTTNSLNVESRNDPEKSRESWLTPESLENQLRATTSV